MKTESASPTTFQAIYGCALGLLMRREHSQLQLHQKLIQRFPEAYPLIKAVIATLAEENYQSDARFASAYLYARIQKGYGPKKISYELKARGIHAEQLEQAFQASDVDWELLKEQVRQKKFGPEALPQDFWNRSKQLTYLQQRGF